MEPFDYLAYKRKKLEEKGIKLENPLKKTYTEREKALMVGCAATFVCCFLLAMAYVGSKSSKIDIEYGRLGKNSNKIVEFTDEVDGEEVTRKEKITVDKRLFLIQQEEQGPSESKTVDKMKDSEVISNSEFNEIKTKNEEYFNNTKQEEIIKPNTTENITVNKVSIKPKIPTTTLPEDNTKVLVKPVGALETSTPSTKVLVGKFYNIEDAKKVQSELPDPSFVKKINGYYSLQVGSFESFEVAKATAGRLKLKGFDAWIYQ